MEMEDFDSRDWRKHLADFVAERWDEELHQPTSLLAPALWQLLSESLSD
jgi:hypothetical protein